MEANCEEEVKKQKAQLESMVSTKMEDAVKEREKFMKENSKLQKELIKHQNIHEDQMRKIRELADEIEAREKEASENRKRFENLQGEMKSKFDEAEMDKSKALSDLNARKDKQIDDLRLEVKTLEGLMKKFIDENPPDEDWSYALTDSYDDVIDYIRETGKARKKVKGQWFVDLVKQNLVPLAVGAALSAVTPPISAALGPVVGPIFATVLQKLK